MYFKKIEMHGFKSFAEPVTIEFSNGITGIVGPNGSGKSNISDAIRWVLGEQSPKMLRGGKMEEVIFSGTSSRKSRGMAEVTLVIDNSDESLPIDYKEVAITRRMFRSGESEYHINGNQCRLRDIRELIMDTGIGVDGYSIIGQGKISEILSSKTESRREIFEEAAGIVMYRTKKAESERKLASTNANMDRVQDIIGEIESRIDGLREDSIKAKEYLELKEKYKESEINIILKNVENLEAKNKYIKDDLQELQENIDSLKSGRDRLEEVLSKYSNRSEVLENISEDTRKSLMETIDELNAMVNKEQIDKERLSAIGENIARLTEEIKVLADKTKRENQSREELKNANKDSDAKLELARKNLDDKLSQYNEISAQMEKLLEQSEKSRNDIFEISGSVSSAKAEIHSLEMLRETLDKRKESLISEKNSGNDSNKENLDRLNNIKSEKERIAQKLEDAKERALHKKSDFDSIQKEERDMSRTFEEARLSIGQLSARKKTIEEMESNYEGYNYAVKFIMRTGLRGIHGVVADLIQVPEGYEIAIETALGAALQNIVCEDDDSAKNAIRALKENKAGRMTFLPVSSVRGRIAYDEKVRNEAGFMGFGPECIDFDHKYRGIMGYLLGRVVIVDDMDNAVRMSKRSTGLRYVTMDGDIINAGGAITGGKYKNKTANILDRKAEITSLEKEIEVKNQLCIKYGDRLAELRENIGCYSEEMQSIEDEIRVCERELMEKDHEFKLTESLLKDLKSNGHKLERELENIETEKKNSLGMIQNLRDTISEKESKIKKTEALSEENIREYDLRKEEFDSLGEEITKARIAVNSCEQEKAHTDALAVKIENNLKELAGEMDEKNTMLVSLEEEKLKITADNEYSDDSIKIKVEKKEKLQSYLEDVAEEKAEINRNTIKVNEEKEELMGRLEQYRNRKYELEIKNTRNETQLDTYKNKLWEDFEVSYVQAMEFKNDEFIMSAAVKENKKIKSRIKELGEVNVGAIEEYDMVKKRYDFLTGQRADIQEAAENLNSIIKDMDRTIKIKFKESFDQIVINFEEKFRELFGGGHAELRLSDEDNPLESNIDIVAQPPGKKLQNINLLSGGEKTLTAIALMFAVLKAKPTPFCILDEVEAALDDANIERFINCLRKLSGIQFALVTHQKSTMEHSDVLYGVTMPEKGVSKVLSLSMDDDFDI